MKIFFTGATGFIGQHILNLLLKSKHDVLCVSRSKLNKQNNIACIQSDLNSNDYYQTVKSFKPDLTIHFSWEGIPNFDFTSSKRNLDISLQLVRFLYSETSCRRFIFSGSCFEYGVKQGECVESDFSQNNLSDFTWAKRSLSEYMRVISLKDSTLNYQWFRIFYAYGPGQKPHSLIPTIVSTIQKKGELKIRTPWNENDYIYVEDLAAAILESIDTKMQNGIYNLGSGKTDSVFAILKLIENQLHIDGAYSSTIEKNFPKNNNFDSFHANMSKTFKALKWRPSTSTQQGLANYLSSQGLSK